MGKLENISGREAVRAFLKKPDGGAIGQVESYLVMVKAGPRVNLSIPQHKELSTGTLILKPTPQGMELFTPGVESLMMIAQKELSFTFLPMNWRGPANRVLAL